MAPSVATVRSLACTTCHAGRDSPCRTWHPGKKPQYRERKAHHIERYRAAQRRVRDRRTV